MAVVAAACRKALVSDGWAICPASVNYLLQFLGLFLWMQFLLFITCDQLSKGATKKKERQASGVAYTLSTSSKHVHSNEYKVLEVQMT